MVKVACGAGGGSESSGFVRLLSRGKMVACALCALAHACFKVRTLRANGDACSNLTICVGMQISTSFITRPEL